MAPIKLEENIKDKLEKRVIDPSDDTWSKLYDKLDKHEGGTNSKMMWWFGIAASLVGVFLVASIFFKNSEVKNVLPITVETPVEKPSEKNVELTEEFEKSKVEAIAETEIKSETTLIKKVKSKQREVSKNNNIIGSTGTALAENIVQDPQMEVNQTIILDSTVIGLTIDQSIVDNTQIKNIDNAVTDSEIEALLENARVELMGNKNKIELSRTVDASSLLQDVETDLDETFRDKVFNTLISGYNSVRTAVASRND